MSSFSELRHRAFYKLLTTRRKGLISLGGECSWTILPEPISDHSIILSAGAGHDISFEKALGDRFGCRILLLDPSPTGSATWERCGSLLPHTEFIAVALAGADGQMSLVDPVNSEEGSFRSRAADDESKFEVPCRSLASLCAEKRWNRIDLLKMDIEGAEYSVIESLIRDRIPVGQICVEFHHGTGFSTSRADTIKAVLMLLQAGYRLVHRIHWDHTFVHKTLL